MIIIAADIVPTEFNVKQFAQGMVKDIVDEKIMAVLNRADYRICNLETPLSDETKPIEKYGPNLIAPTSCVNGLKEIGINLITLANNHIMDQNTDGLISTIQALKNKNISFVGAGKNIHEASKPFYFSVADVKYGVYACTEHEFSIADENHYGANPFEPLDSPDHVKKMKSACDYAIVLYHGGKEQYRFPSPYLQKVCRKLVEEGADLVICQHSHCIGCEEKYQGGTIVYGQGNFIFNMQNNEYWNTGMLVGIRDDGSIEYYPIELEGNRVCCATGDRARQIMNDFRERSEEIKDPCKVEERYNAFADESIENYLLNISGIRRKIAFRVAQKAGFHRFQKNRAKKYKDQAGIIIRNYIECEAHRELLLRGLTRK